MLHNKKSLEGDLNVVQYLALNYVIAQERSLIFEIEKERMKYTLLAGNPSLYKSLYEDKDIEGETTNWITPTSAEEMEELIRAFEGPNG